MTKNNNSSNHKRKDYCNQFVINRTKHKTNYTVISNLLIRDERLTAIDKGIMLMILSNDDTKYILNTTVIQKQSGLGKLAFWKSIKKLTDFGYINKQRIKGGVKWVINELPVKNNGHSDNSISPNIRINSISPDFRSPEISSTEISSNEIRTLISNKAPAENCKQFPSVEERKKENKINNNERGKIENFSSLGLSSSLSSVVDNHTPMIKNNNNKTNTPMINTYNIQEIQKEIKDYKSKYFTVNNYEFITNAYNEFKKEIPTKINLTKFEGLLFYHYYNRWLSDNPAENITNDYLNRYISNDDYGITPNDLKVLVKLINTNKDINNQYSQALKLTLPIAEPVNEIQDTTNLIKGCDGKYYTQQQIDNYEDIKFN